MIFVLDGPDGVGKTTLAKRITERLGCKYLHLGYRWKDKINLYHDAAIRRCAKQQESIVLDRWWPSEAVYAKAYRGGSPWPMYGRMAERVAKRLCVVYVYCLPDNVQEAVSRHDELKQEREEMYDDISTVARLYLDLWHGNRNHLDQGSYIDQLILNGGVKDQLNCVRYSISQWGHVLDLFIDRLIETALDLIEMQYQPALNYSEWNVLGHLAQAKYLFVGDRVNPKYREMFWPFYEYGNSSLFLTETLHKINYKEEWGMWCNAFNHDGSLNLNVRQIAMQKPLKIITLGRVATEMVLGQGLDVYKEAPHPSYVKRFNKIDLVEVFKHAICD